MSTTAGPIDTLVRHTDWAALNRHPALTEDDVAACEAFAARLRAMSDTDVAALWGITRPGVIAEIRELFATPWT